MAEWQQQHEVQLQREAQRRLELQQQQLGLEQQDIKLGQQHPVLRERHACYD
jgi:hypothetical protein